MTPILEPVLTPRHQLYNFFQFYPPTPEVRKVLWYTYFWKVLSFIGWEDK